MRVVLATLPLLLCALPAAAQDLPPRKVGLWELTITHEGVRMPPQRWQQCIDAETDRRMRNQWLSADGPECKVQGISRAGGVITVDKTCGSGMSLRGVIAGVVLCFIPIVGEFVIPDLLGGSESTMIGQTLWNEFFANRDWPVASAVAVVLLCVLLVPIVFHQHLQMRALEKGR